MLDASSEPSVAQDTGTTQAGIGPPRRLPYPHTAIRSLNLWACLIDDEGVPRLDNLDLEGDSDLAEFSVLLDLSEDPGDPAIASIGVRLALLCPTAGEAATLDEVPQDCLLAHIGDAARKCVSLEKPVKFAALATSRSGRPLGFRGNFLPVAMRDDRVDHVYAIISDIDERGSQAMANQDSNGDVLLLEQELITAEEPGGEAAIVTEPGVLLLDDELDPAPVVKSVEVGPRVTRKTMPDVAFGEDDTAPDGAADEDLPTDDALEAPVVPSPSAEIDAPDEPLRAANDLRNSSALAELLSEARKLADAYGNFEARTRAALYAAIGRAYDFSLLVRDHPEDYQRMLDKAGLEVQERAPYTPIVKLVFGVNYDKSRVAEFAAVIAHGHRKGLPAGELAQFLTDADGGLKGVLNLERLLRKAESGEPLPDARIQARPAIAKKLRALSPLALDDIAHEGDEFALVMARRNEDGSVELVGEVPRDIPLLEKAARKIFAEQTRERNEAEDTAESYTEEV